MAFRFNKASCVVVGTLNIYIIQPHLLLEIKAIENLENPEDAIEFETDFSQPGFRFAFPEKKLRCTVRPDRFIAESDVANIDCGGVVGKLVTTLKWTPFKALGINSQFSTADPDDIQKLCAKWIPVFTNSTVSSIKQRSVHAAVSVGDSLVNLQIAIKGNVAEFSANSHFQLDNRGDRNAIANVAEKVTNDFFEWRRTAQSLASQLFDLEFENANDNG